MPSWDDFLAKASDKHSLFDEDDRQAFLKKFAQESLDRYKSDAQVATNLNISEVTLQRRLGNVYEAFSQSCPDLKSNNKKGKFKILRDWLKGGYRDYQETGILPWLIEITSEVNQEVRLPPPKIDWRDICNQVLATQQLRRQATAQQYELNIYVPLGLMERPKTPNPRPNRTGEESQPQKEPELQIVQTYKDDAFFQKVIAENNTEKCKQIAIIGEPGAGKTTLLGELAERLPKNSPNFPICIRLADLRDLTIKDYLVKNWLEKAVEHIEPVPKSVTPEIIEALKQLFRQGKVWLLLDGVDEMAAESPVEALAKIREQLTDWVGKARVVLTCRLNVWDATNSNTLTNFDTYKTLEFEPDDVDEFIRQWFEEASQDEKRRNSGNETFWLEQGKRLQQQLKEPGKDNIRRMVRNPLRLSMLCQSWCVSEQDLPETKAALYEQFTTYFFEWKQVEFENKNRVLKETDEKQIQKALAKLALAAMESVNRFRIEKEFAIEQMEEEWFNLAEEWGWLVLVDRDNRKKKPVYEFFHSTFQEYFAATAIPDWDFFLNHQIPPVSDRYRIFEPQWKEVILLWLGRENIEAQKQEFIDALVNFDDGCGEWGDRDVVKGLYEYQAYFLATAAIAEFQNYSQIDKVIGQVVRWGFGYFDTEEQKWVIFFNVISDAAKEALPQAQRPKAIAALVKLLSSPNLPDLTCWEVAKSLGKIGQGNQKAIDALAQLLSSPNLDCFGWTRSEVVGSLGKIGQGNQKAIDAFVQMLSSPNLNHETYCQVAYSLGKIGQGNQKAIDALVQMLSSPNLDDEDRCLVADSLGQIDQGNQKAIDALVQMLSSPNLDDENRGGVAEILEKIDPGNQTAINAFVELLSSPNLDDENRWTAADRLEKIDPGNQTAIDALVQLLSCPNLSHKTCLQVAERLWKIDLGNQTAIDAFVQVLSSPNLDDYTRWTVAESLENIDPGNQTAIDALVQMLSSPNLDDHTRWRVAKRLEKIDPGNQKVIDAFVQMLSSPNLDDSTRWQVADRLEKIDSGNQKAIDAFVQLLSSPNLDDFTRWKAAESLGNIDPGNQKVIDALMQVLSSPNLDDYTRWKVAESLWKIDSGNQKAIDALVQLLSSPNLLDETRWQVAESLLKIDPGNQTAIDALVQLLSSPNLDNAIRWRVAKSLGRIDQGNQKAIDAFVQMLSSPNLNLLDDTRWQVVESLLKIDPGNQKAIDALVQMLSSLSLNHKTHKYVPKSLNKILTDNQFDFIAALEANFNGSQKIDKHYYQLMWKCVQNTPYPDFYQAWHQDTLPNSGTANINLVNLPQDLADAINDRPDLCNKVKLICIDSDKFGNPENPATKIYNEMRLQGCDKSEDGKPKTMAELQNYWDELRIESEIPLFFICYDSTALSATPTGFSDSFMKALSKFDRAICVVCEPGDIPLQNFSPQQQDLVAAIVQWIEKVITENY